MIKIELSENLFPINHSVYSVPTSSLFSPVQTREEDACLLLSCLLDIFTIENVLVDSGCKNQCHISVLQGAVSRDPVRIFTFMT